jgi:hypothetical protein
MASIPEDQNGDNLEGIVLEHNGALWGLRKMHQYSFYMVDPHILDNLSFPAGPVH